MIVEEKEIFSTDDAFAFANRLRGAPSGMNDPSDASAIPGVTWPVKIYRGGERLPLRGAAPWWMPAAPTNDSMLKLGRLLFHTASISRVRWQPGGTLLNSPQQPAFVLPAAKLTVRRPVPSGGALYPTELYVVMANARSVSTVFHYNPARHEVTDLAQPHVLPALREALRLSDRAPIAPMTIVLTHCFGKNLQKYRNFAYRLGAVDLGVVLGRLAYCGTQEFGDVAVYVDFIDEQLNDMCRLDTKTESAYAVVGLGSLQDASDDQQRRDSQPLPAVAVGQDRLPQPSALFAAMHSAACDNQLTAAKLDNSSADLGPELRPTIEGKSMLPLLPCDSALTVDRQGLLLRTSNGAYFTGAPLDAELLASILARTHEALEALKRVCYGSALPVVQLHCAVDRVNGIPASFYHYNPKHYLVAVKQKDSCSPAAELQRALYAATVDLERSAFSVHISTLKDFRNDMRGARAYRVQQMFVGAAVEAVTRWCAAHRVGSHPIHGFDAHRVERMYGLEDGPLGIEAQVSVGVARHAGALEGSIVS